jgi:hypothetical protein
MAQRQGANLTSLKVIVPGVVVRQLWHGITSQAIRTAAIMIEEAEEHLYRVLFKGGLRARGRQRHHPSLRPLATARTQSPFTRACCNSLASMFPEESRSHAMNQPLLGVSQSIQQHPSALTASRSRSTCARTTAAGRRPAAAPCAG